MPRKNQLETIDNILEFWFADGQTATEVAGEKSQLWWSKNDDVDRQITQRFAVTTAAATGELSHWCESARGMLALIICTDQFPRNMYRNTSQAFAYDSIALNLAKQCVDCAAVEQLQPIERVFVYLPFEHSEQLDEQQRSVALYQDLAKNVATNERELFTNYYDFANKHFEIIRRFGRFPHRNTILGRPSTEAELVFLEQPGSSF